MRVKLDQSRGFLYFTTGPPCEVHSMLDGDVVAMEFCSDSLMLADDVYVMEPEISSGSLNVADGLNESPLIINILDSNLNLIKMSQVKDSKLSEVSRRKLNLNDNLTTILGEMRPFESVCISDRTVSIRQKAFVIASGKEFISIEHPDSGLSFADDE